MAQRGPDFSITVQERVCNKSLHQGGDKATMSSTGNKPKEHPGYDGANLVVYLEEENGLSRA